MNAEIVRQALMQQNEIIRELELKVDAMFKLIMASAERIKAMEAPAIEVSKGEIEQGGSE